MGLAIIKRLHMPMAVKLRACLYALGMDPARVDFHHEPPLSHRPIDQISGDTIPPQNDPKHIMPMLKDAHRARTTGNHIPLSGDTSIAAKLKRNEEKEAAFRAKLLSKEPGKPRPKKSKIPSRPFRSERRKPR